MACNLQLLHVNLVVAPAGQTSVVRVLGRATGCPGNQVTVSTSVTAQMSVAVDPATDRFAADLPLTAGGTTCGATITVEAWCSNLPANDPANCLRSEQWTLDCCSVQIVSAAGFVPSGSLTPTRLQVTGTLLGCFGDKVVVSSTVTGQSPATAIDPLTGGFFVDLPITTAVNCGDRVTVRAWCDSDPTCFTERDVKLDCPGCFRAQVSASTAPCVGTPPMQPVTLQAVIHIPAGAVMTFQWNYGDGSFGLPFTVNNVGGTGTTPHSHTEPPHNYATGSYTATLAVVPPPYECPPVSIALTVQCQPGCPTGTVTRTGEASTCVNGKRTVTLEATVTAPSTGAAVGQWDYGYAPAGGSSLGPSIYVPAGQTQSPATNSALKTTWDYPPGSYTACVKLNAQAHPGCPDICTTFTVSDCPPPTCEVKLSYTPQPLPCLSIGGSLKVDFEATLNPPNPAYTGPFTWEVTQGGVSLFKVTQNAPAVANPQKFSYVFTAPGAYDVTVTIATPQCDDPFDTDVAHLVIKDCCPVFAGPLSAVEISACEWFFSAVVDNPNNVPVSFDWKFHDGGTAHTLTPTVSHVYAVGSITTGTTEVTLHAQGCPDQTLTTTVTHRCFSSDTVPPTVGGCGVTAGTRGTITVTFSEDVNQAAATNPGNFAVTVNGSPRVPTSLTYSPNTTTINGINVSPGDSVQVTVTNVADKAGNVIAANNSASCSAPGGGGMNAGCWALLVAALLLGVVACILGIIAACAGNPYLGIAAGIVGAVALVLLILWLIFCAPGNCGIFNWVRWIVIWILMIAPIVGIIVGIFANPLCGVIATGILWGYWGVVLAILDIAGPKIGCPLLPPPFP